MLAGLHEWPLIVFTVLAQSAIGAFIVLSFPLLSGILSAKQQVSVHRSMFFIWLLMGIAVLLSTLHLGSPLRAVNALLRVGSSNLSNEIFAAALFFTVGGLYWLVAILGKMPAGLGKGWLIITLLSGLYFIYAMCQVYQISTVPTWNNAFTSIYFTMTMLIGGSILGAALLRPAIEESPFTARLLPFVAITALLISLASQFIQLDDLVMQRSSITQALNLIPNYGQLLALRLVTVALGLACWLYPLTRQKSPSIVAISVGFILVMLGEMIARGVFYGLHMTVGVTFAG